MGDQGALILKQGEEVWVVRLDLASSTVAAVDPVPTASWQNGHFFDLGGGNVTT